MSLESELHGFEYPQLVTASDISEHLRSQDPFLLVPTLSFDQLHRGTEFVYVDYDAGLYYVRVEAFSENGRPQVVRRVMNERRNLELVRGIHTDANDICTLMGSCEGVDSTYKLPVGISEEPGIAVSRCAWFLVQQTRTTVDSDEEATEFHEEVSEPIRNLAVAA